MSDGAYELGLERGWGGKGGGGVSYLNNVSYVSRNRKCDGSRHTVVPPPPTDVMSHGHSLTPRPEAAAVNSPRR